VIFAVCLSGFLADRPSLGFRRALEPRAWWAAVDSNHLPPRKIGLSAVLTTRLDLESGKRNASGYVVRASAETAAGTIHHVHGLVVTLALVSQSITIGMASAALRFAPSARAAALASRPSFSLTGSSQLASHLIKG
jgi:hypothetical protein